MKVWVRSSYRTERWGCQCRCRINKLAYLRRNVVYDAFYSGTIEVSTLCSWSLKRQVQCTSTPWFMKHRSVPEVCLMSIHFHKVDGKNRHSLLVVRTCRLWSLLYCSCWGHGCGDSRLKKKEEKAIITMENLNSIIRNVPVWRRRFSVKT